MKESTIMKIHYGTALASVGLVAVHGFNGLRVILLELKQGRVYEKAISYGCVVGMMILIGYGSRTIIMTNMGMV